MSTVAVVELSLLRPEVRGSVPINTSSHHLFAKCNLEKDKKGEIRNCPFFNDIYFCIDRILHKE